MKLFSKIQRKNGNVKPKKYFFILAYGKRLIAHVDFKNLHSLFLKSLRQFHIVFQDASGVHGGARDGLFHYADSYGYLTISVD